jgi:Ca2+/Na+ antiporter
MLRKKQLFFNDENTVSTKNSHTIYFYFKKLLTIYDNIKKLLVSIYSYFIPCPQKYSIFCFVIIFVLTYIHTQIILSVIATLSSLINLTASFLGMTILSWAGNVGDTVNASVATKLNAVELLTTTILGTQVMNLQICLGIPWLISILKNYYYNGRMILDFKDKNPLNYFLPLFLVVLASIFVLTLFNVNLNRRSGICLILIYIIYLVYEFKHNFQ